MATVPSRQRTRAIVYPTRDGRPMAETELHMEDLIDTVQVLHDRYADQPEVYAWGNMMLCYEEGDPRKHVAPDVFVAFGVPKKPRRDHYLVWKEGKAPDFVTEITSKSTKREDQKKKFAIYRDILKVTEYFLYDPRGDYLHPPLQGFRLVDGNYVPIEPVDGRLPSEVLGLHLERDGSRLRFVDPTTGQYLLTRLEAQEAAERRAEDERQRAEDERRRAEDERQRAEDERRRAEDERQRAETADRRAETADRRAETADHRAETAEAGQQRLAEENERLRRELEALRGK